MVKFQKIGQRVPRASNLVDLKLLLLNFKEKQELKDLQNFDKFKKESYLVEYLKLLKLIGLIIDYKYYLSLTENGKEIKNIISSEDILTERDKEILKKEFLHLEIVARFLKNVFDFDIIKKYHTVERCLSKDDIKEKYLTYRKISESVAERESRLIYNWLLDLSVIESLRIIHNGNKRLSFCYHIIGNDLHFDEFNKKIKLTIFKAMKDTRKKSEWIEIPKVRNLFCIENSISKEQFDKHFIEYITKYPFKIQLSTGSLLRKEVETEGIEINNKLYFYVKLIRGIINE